MKESDVREILPDSAEIADGRLRIGGVDVASLAEEYGTPLYVYDAATIEGAAREVRDVFSGVQARTSYASKACAITAILGVLERCGLDVDVVSLGELEAALRAGFGPERIHLHGNVKSREELERAVSLGIHAIVLDNVEEIELLSSVAERAGAVVPVMLRLALPIEAETHPHLRTAGRATKFGIVPDSNDYVHACRVLGASRRLRLMGIHVHLGSQITDVEVYGSAAAQLIGLADSLRADGFAIEEISTGGGWAIAYVPGGATLRAQSVAMALLPHFSSSPYRLAIEPGRALIARSAVAIYRVGSVKHTDGGRIVAVDGGMGDNPRHALYGAPYHAILPSAPSARPIGPADVVGRYCESGDVLARGVPLADVRGGDLLCLPVAGAYQLSMASAYNLVPQPATVLVEQGAVREIVRRATLTDLLSRDVDAGIERS